MLALAAAAAMSAFACTARPASPAPAPPATITVGLPQVRQVGPRPGLTAVADIIANERLTASDGQGRTRPLLLEGWTVAEDGLTWRLTIRPDIRFQDGSLMTTADVARTIEEDRAQSGPMAACLGDIASVVPTGDRDVAVSLKHRCSFLLDDVTRAVTRPAKDGKSVIGTGAYAIVSLTPDELVLDANPHYHEGPPAIARIVMRPYDTLRTAWADMMRGSVDLLLDVGPDSAEFLLDQASIDVRTFVTPYVNVLLLNSARPLFEASAVRRALNLAVDRAALVQQGHKGQAVPADGPTWPGHWAHAGAPAYTRYNPDQAADLLAGARASAGRKASTSAQWLLEFTCLVPARFALLERLALLTQRQLADVGVRMRLESVPPEKVGERLTSGDFEAILLPFLSGPYAWVPHRLWHSPGATRRWNYWGYRNADVDSALDAMRDARDEAGFTQALRRFEAAFDDDPPAVPLTWNKTVQALSRRFVLPAESNGRDALHFISRLVPRAPDEGRP